MATKLAKSTFPSGTGPNDWQCFGPPATKDGDFDSVKIADLGCFNQEGVDSNKYYHGAIVKHKTNGQWGVYFEWGRTGAKSPQFQFVTCSSESEAQREFASQLHEKNDKRGEWATIAGIRTLRAKSGKDCYLVRPQATRSTGLPDARSIKSGEGVVKQVTKTTPIGGSKIKIDPQTMALMRDLNVATVSYTRGAMADSSLPTQQAIDEARQILIEAQKRVAAVGDDVKNQVADRDLKQLTAMMYGRIPKKKELHSDPVTWILSQNNIMVWGVDLDAFEAALKTQSDITETTEQNPLEGMNVRMEWVSPTSAKGKFIYDWMPKATRNRHSYIGDMRIHNVWEVEHHQVRPRFMELQIRIAKGTTDSVEKALFQPRERIDLASEVAKRYYESNTAMLFHGTRSVNVSGILRERLRLPKQLVGVVITGAMFGPGCYFADDWKKSAGYTSLDNSYWSQGGGSVKGRNAFMFVADVPLGKPYLAPRAHGYTAPPAGHHSVFGKGGHSHGNSVSLQNNEWIVFDILQNDLRYLVEFSAPKGNRW